jgi:hypothetical protein
MLDNQLSPADLEQNWASLETRVQRLEDAVAAMQDTHLMEERILERLHDRPEAHDRAQVKIGPAPVDDHITADHPPATTAPVPPAPQPPAAPPPMSALAELRAMVRMFFDVHYHVAWTTRLLTLILLALILTSYWWFPLSPNYLPVIGHFFDKTVAVLLAFILYRVLAREARRYVLYRGQ